MRGKSLHSFDLQLCDYVAGNVVQYFDNREFADWVRSSVPEALAKYLDDRFAEVESPETLLGDKELYALVTATENPPLELDRAWLPYKALHKRYVSTISDIRKQLCPQAAEDWAVSCAEFATRLSEPGLSLHDGIIIVQEWLWQLRRVLLAMEAIEFVCFPQGNLPTPLQSNPPGDWTLPNATQGMPKEFLDRIERLRRFLQENRDHRKLKPDAVIKAVHIGKQLGRTALRWLKARGEYEGFMKEQPQRFIDGRENEQ